ncbi:hypothetical protein CCR75_001773 [Bremia lactucae]|uniref:Uncharacterized protein n=1 Tax=Bremia lactucae TaxID=4779 RepID=A0A976NXG1_BRELC|nr:hypothetical protein CCR75_001773 [Bremia lactucae]
MGKKDEGRGPWVTEAEVLSSVVDTTGLNKLSFSHLKLQNIGLACGQLGQVSAEEEAAGKGPVHVMVVPSEPVPPQVVLWLLTGCVDDALATKGIRSKLFWMASSRTGYYDPARRIGDKNVAFWYEDKNLCFHVLFKVESDALKFETGLLNGPHTLGSPLTGHQIETHLAQTRAVSVDLKRIIYHDYNPNDSKSRENTISSLTTSVSILDLSTDEFRYQRIEHEKFFKPYGKAESCHLVSRKDNRDHQREYGKYDRDVNNRLALSREMHGWFDGLSIEFPIVNMLPGTIEDHPSIGDRRKVEILVKAFDAGCKDRVFSRLKDGSADTDDPLVMKTFVHVKDPDTFCLCLRWKYNNNAQLASSFFEITPAID